MAFDMTTPGDSKDVGSSASDPFNIDKQHAIAPAKSNAILMICPDTQSKEVGLSLTAIKNAGFQSFKIVYANQDLQTSQILAKDPSNSRTDVESIAYSSVWYEEHKNLFIKALGISEEELSKIFYTWDNFILKHDRYSEFLDIAKTWFLTDKTLHNEILRSVKGYLDTYCAEISCSILDFKAIDFAALLSADVSSLENMVMKSLRHSLDYKLKEVAGLLVKAESRAHILLYPGNLDPGMAAAIKKIHQIPEYTDYILFQKIERKKIKQILTIGDTETISLPPTVLREHTPTIRGSATYHGSFFDLPENPSYESLVLVLHNAVKNAKDPTTALRLIADMQQRLLDYQMSILHLDYSQNASLESRQAMDEDRGIKYTRQ